MTLTIVSSTVHKVMDGTIYAYGPYVREMNVWIKYVDKVIVVAPLSQIKELSDIEAAYSKKITFIEVPSFSILSLKNTLRTFFLLPILLSRLYKGIKMADHLHMRCPCNLSLLACFVQVLFPNKKKSTKYAGNWDPKSIQPWSYRLQKYILSNTTLTKNIQVLVYGEWKNQSKNIQAFISATYYESEIIPFIKRDYSQRLKFVFAGSLVVGKRPLLTIQIIEELNKKGIDSELHMFGDGALMSELKRYVNKNQLEKQVHLYGNRDKSEVKDALMDAHFNILPSRSEGWPKAVAEGMFFGAIPISTRISCLEWMLDDENRGILIEPDLDLSVAHILHVIKTEDLDAMASAALIWSQQYTYNRLEADIKEVLLGVSEV